MADDLTVGLGRRHALKLLAGAGAAALIGCSSSSTSSSATSTTASPASSTTTSPSSTTSGSAPDGACVLTPEQEEGPFYVDVGLLRSDITEGRTGVPLDLTITVVDAATCEPRPDAAVDIWHADPTGLYSDEDSEGTAGQTFLRGIQVTGADGVARFTTLVPGWYTGRTLHIHVKVRLGGQTSGTSFRGGNVSHTGQLFFDPSFDDDLAAAPDYVANASGHTTNAADSIYTGQDGHSSLLDTTGSVDAGYTGTITLAVDAGGGGASKT